MFRRYPRFALGVGLAAAIAAPAAAQSLTELPFLGTGCVAENSRYTHSEGIADIAISFDDFTLYQSSPQPGLNSIHCKFALVIKQPKGRYVVPKSADFHLQGQGNPGFAAKLVTTMFDGKAMLSSRPLATNISLKELPKKVTITRLGADSVARYCAGQTVRYEISVFLIANPVEMAGLKPGQRMSSLRISGVDNVLFEERDCS